MLMRLCGMLVGRLMIAFAMMLSGDSVGFGSVLVVFSCLVVSVDRHVIS